MFILGDCDSQDDTLPMEDLDASVELPDSKHAADATEEHDNDNTEKSSATTTAGTEDDDAMTEELNIADKSCEEEDIVMESSVAVAAAEDEVTLDKDVVAVDLEASQQPAAEGNNDDNLDDKLNNDDEIILDGSANVVGEHKGLSSADMNCSKATLYYYFSLFN